MFSAVAVCVLLSGLAAPAIDCQGFLSDDIPASECFENNASDRARLVNGFETEFPKAKVTTAAGCLEGTREQATATLRNQIEVMRQVVAAQNRVAPGSTAKDDDL